MKKRLLGGILLLIVPLALSGCSDETKEEDNRDYVGEIEGELEYMMEQHKAEKREKLNEYLRDHQ
ncbi:hypothetical protein JMJ99_10795 [Companilactobacillus zhachilii]|uniref:hypothetical protein n=1 Tax=Companilactobacillus zhachilii TaxID=2304606 RepID=UPI001921EC69|nr:hypothetical protein [Companilactobacillus zhachilii]MBL3531857.1 hypothetical protein [Companilactobacillus zhachilii]